MDKKKIKILKNISTALVIVAMIFAFLIAGIRIFGVQVYGVLTGSMEPTYPVGSMIYVKRVDADDLRVNDVITFSISPNVIATHRIVEVVPDENNPSTMLYRTKGDANKDVDAALVNGNNIIGKVMFAIPQMGYIANYIQEPPGIYVAILICGLMIAFVFYTDSLENKQKAYAQRGNKRSYAPQRQSRMQQTAKNRAYPRQDEYGRRRETSRRGDYVRREEYPRRRETPRRDDYPSRREYPRRSDYGRQWEYDQQDEYIPRRQYPRQRER